MSKKKKLDTIGSILKIEFAGNYRDDAEKFERINEFLRQKGIHPILKFAADVHANWNGMGMTVNYPGDDYYDNYEKENT